MFDLTAILEYLRKINSVRRKLEILKLDYYDMTARNFIKTLQ